MTELNEYAKSVLRSEVLSCRTELRRTLEKAKEIERDYASQIQNVKLQADRIRDLQTALGDPIEIDPQHPEIT